MRNRDNNTGGIFFDFLKIFAFAFLLLLLKYVAIALGTIGLIVGLIYMTIRNLYLLLYCLIFEPESKSTCYEFA